MTRDPEREASGLRHRLRRAEALLQVACDALDDCRPGLGSAIHAAPDGAHAALVAAIWDDGPQGAPEAPPQHQEAPS
jgi:hypothetical protein